MIGVRTIEIAMMVLIRERERERREINKRTRVFIRRRRQLLKNCMLMIETREDGLFRL
jgi:hypothetical protein